MTTVRTRLKVSFTSEEKEKVTALAQRLRLTQSELLRRLVLAERLPSGEVFALSEGIRDLLKVNADLARLGNLLKLALDVGDGALTPIQTARIDALAGDIAETQGALKRLVADLHHQAHPRSSLGHPDP